MKFSKLLPHFALVSTVLAVPNKVPPQHHDQHPNAKRDVLVVTEYVNQNGDVVIPPESIVSATTVATNEHTATATLSNNQKTTTTLSPSSDPSTTASHHSTNTKIDKFEDGKYKCSDFPSFVSGVISLDWIGLGGWSSVQDSNGQAGTSCENGMYCSYACDVGQVKTQWPENQPDNGSSLGGLYCKDGYLYRTNKNFDNLCEDTDSQVTVVNNVDTGEIALCRTDYPGSENMNIPTVVESGKSQPLAVIDQDTYYKWSGKPTSAQYYVNNAGVSKENGCIWGDSQSEVGNWAPLVIGAGKSNGMTYLSLIENPNNHKSANFNVKFKGDHINGGDACSYVNGKLSSSDGCTVSVLSGSVEIIFY